MSNSESQRLKRVLKLRDLLVYGMMIMQVIAPVPIFGLLEQRSNNHSVTMCAGFGALQGPDVQGQPGHQRLQLTSPAATFKPRCACR